MVHADRGSASGTQGGGGSRRFFGDEHLSEKMGRHRVGKKAKRLEEKLADQELERILKRDMAGGNSGSVGAKAMAKMARNPDISSSSQLNGNGNGKGKGKGKDKVANGGENEVEMATAAAAAEKRSKLEAIAARRMGMGILGRQRVLEDPAKRVSCICVFTRVPTRIHTPVPT